MQIHPDRIFIDGQRGPLVLGATELLVNLPSCSFSRDDPKGEGHLAAFPKVVREPS